MGATTRESALLRTESAGVNGVFTSSKWSMVKISLLLNGVSPFTPITMKIRHMEIYFSVYFFNCNQIFQYNCSRNMSFIFPNFVNSEKNLEKKKKKKKKKS